MSDEPRIYPHPHTDRLATIVRGTCGVFLGVALAAEIWVRCGGFGPWASAALFAFSVVGCALGSMRHGDSFWYGLLYRGR